MRITLNLRKLTVILGVSLMWVSNAAAISNYDLTAITRYTPFYDERACENGAADAGTGGPSGGPLVGSDNVAKAFNYFVNKGLTPEQSAGILGNLMQESGVDPASKQSGGPGRGIAQWSVGDRWDALIAWAAGKNPEDLGVQLDYMWYEMTKVPPWDQTLPALKGTSSVDDAVMTFEEKYEKAGKPNFSNRIQYAKEVLAKYGNGVPAGGGTSAPTTDAAASCAGAADDAAGAAGAAVNTAGYAFPLEPGTKSGNGGVNGMSPLPCSGNCHHDNTPAFDIGRQPGSDKTAGAIVYAIHAGTVEGVGIYDSIPGCYKLHLSSEETDGHWDYFYAHLGKVLRTGAVAAGTPIAVVGPRKCTGNGSDPHLHIDRGCDHKGGGYDDCRDPGIIPIINSLYNALPA